MDILQIILPVVLIGAGALLVIYIAKNRSRKNQKKKIALILQREWL